MTRNQFQELVYDVEAANEFHAACQMAYQYSKSEVALQLTKDAYKKKMALQAKLASIKTAHHLARTGLGYVGIMQYGYDLTSLQMELVRLRKNR